MKLRTTLLLATLALSPLVIGAPCVDCHVKQPDGKDARLSTLMKAKMTVKKVKHPPINMKDIPASCLKCHPATGKPARPLSNLLHVAHLGGTDLNKFRKMFNGDCRKCHQMSTTGDMAIPSGPEK